MTAHDAAVIAEHLAFLFGDPDDPTTVDGWVFLGQGHDPTLTDTGAVQYARWTEDPYRWPAQAAEVVTVAAGTGADVFVTPCRSANPFRGSARRTPLSVGHSWADLDQLTDTTRARVAELVARGAWLVRSGSDPDRCHVYLPLEEPVAAADAVALNRRLAAWLGGDPAVGGHNGYLRLAGTLNRKPTARGDAPVLVQLVAGNGAVFSVAELAEELPDVTPSPAAGVEVGDPEELPDELPATLAALAAEAVVAGMDRSDRTMVLVSAAHDAGLTLGQAVELAGRHAPSREKYGPRLAREVGRCWGKVVGNVADLDALAGPAVGGSTTPPADALAGAVASFRRWLHLPDPSALYAVLATFVANQLDADPTWLLVVGPPSSGKTEVLNAITRRPGVHPAATLTEGALLSGTPKKEAQGAKGGLLRAIGPRGLLLLKDFTSVLAQNKDTRAAVLGALRELYDGAWTRHVGTDGGRTLHWEGHLGLIGGCTPAIDRHHAVLAALGDRFMLLRLPPVAAEEVGTLALAHLGRERQMRTELAAAAGSVLDAADLGAATRALTDDEHHRLLALAIFAVRARSAVERDGYTREVLAIPEPEGPPRFLLALRRLMGGLEAIGCTTDEVWSVLAAVAVDSMPATRRRLLAQLIAGGNDQRTGALAAGAELPTKTAAVHLEDLALLGLALRAKTSDAANAHDLWSPSSFAERYWPLGTGGSTHEIPVSASSERKPFTHPSPQEPENRAYFDPAPTCVSCGADAEPGEDECRVCLFGGAA